MSTSDDNSWEDHWRNEINNHSPLPSIQDWQGMTILIDRDVPVNAQHVIEQDPIGYNPWTIRKLRLGWSIGIGLLLLVTALGIWLGSVNGEVVHQEMKATVLAQDTFPPHYALDRYWTYDKEGNRVGAMHSDTVWMDRTMRKRGVYALISPGKVADYRIDTVLHISGRGGLLSVRQDTIFLSEYQLKETFSTDEGHHLAHDDCALDVVYIYDTTYALDRLGNLTNNIVNVDCIIIYSPSVRD